VAGCGRGAATSAPATKGGFVRLDAPPERFRPSRRKLLLAVGIQDYDPGGGWRSLSYAARDAAEVAATLEAGGFTTVDLLQGRVRRTDLREALDRLEREVRDSSDVVLVYVSAHGTLARGPGGSLERYLVTSESTLQGAAQSALPVAELQERFERLVSRRKVLIMATCHSGSGKSELPGELLSELRTYKSAFFPPPMETASHAAIVIGASGWGEPAREDAELQHDVYTYYFLEAIRRGYDPDADGGVTVTEAHDYARRLTYQRSGGAQRPYLRSDILGSDPILLAGAPRAVALPLLLSFGPDLSGLHLSVNGESKGVLPGSTVLAAGDNRIELSTAGGQVLARREVAVAPGERLVLEDLLAAPALPPHGLEAALGYASFLDSRSRARLVEPLVLPRLAVSRRGLFGGRLRLFGELALSPGSQGSTVQLGTPSGRVAAVPSETFAAQAGLGGAWTLLGGERLRLEVAPVLTLLVFERHLEIPGAPEDEGYLGLAPALELALRLRLHAPLFVAGGLRLSYVAFRVDEGWRHLALAYTYLGVGVAF